jgi:hypothetical protein
MPGGTSYQFDDFSIWNTNGNPYTSNAGFLGRMNWSPTLNNGSNPSVTYLNATTTTFGGYQITTNASTGADSAIFIPGDGAFQSARSFHTGGSWIIRTSVTAVTADTNSQYRFGVTTNGGIGGLSDGGGQNAVWIEKNAADTSWYGYCGNTSNNYSRTSALASVTTSQIAFQIQAISGAIYFKTASTLTGLTSASAVQVSNTAYCPSFAGLFAFGVYTAANTAKSLDLWFWDILPTGLSQ